MEKTQWATYIGLFLIAMNEIDGMTLICQENVVGKKPSKTWIKKSLSKRLKSLCDSIKTDDSIRNELHEYLQRTLQLCPQRNQLAHGLFLLDCDRPLKQDSENQTVLYSNNNILLPIRHYRKPVFPCS